MRTKITTRHFELSESLRQRTEDRLNKLHRFFDRIMDARVVVSFEKNRYKAEATLTANGTPITSHAVGESGKVAVEQVMDKLEVQIRRHKDRMTKQQRRRTRTGKVAAAAGTTIEAAEEEAETGRSDPFDETDLDGLVSDDPGDFEVNMSVAEAAAQLRVSRRETLGFTDSVTSRRMLVFKRRDGNVGIVDIQDGGTP
jgi:putative sigma-54 modulation protein